MDEGQASREEMPITAVVTEDTTRVVREATETIADLMQRASSGDWERRIHTSPPCEEKGTEAA